MTTGTRKRVTQRAHRNPKPSTGSRTGAVAWRALRGRIRAPTKPSIAGTRVSAISTAVSTVPAAARPIAVRNGTPTRLSPASAMTTVAPANSTAEPAVAVALATDSSSSSPSASCDR